MALSSEQLLKLKMDMKMLAVHGHKGFIEPMYGYCKQTIRLLSTEQRESGMVTTTVLLENVTSRAFKKALIKLLRPYHPYRVSLVRNGEWSNAEQALLDNWDQIPTFTLPQKSIRTLCRFPL